MVLSLFESSLVLHHTLELVDSMAVLDSVSEGAFVVDPVGVLERALFELVFGELSDELVPIWEGELAVIAVFLVV